jgi:Protein DA1
MIHLPSRVSKLLLTAILALAPLSPAFAEDLPSCAGCGGEIGPGKYVQDQWGANYHTQHANLKRCHYCARGISSVNTGGGVRYPDGRDVCNICQGTAVTDDATAIEAADRIRGRMEAWGLRFAYGDIPVKLVDQRTLDRQFGRSMGAHEGKISGLTTKKWTKDRTGKITAREVSIAMLYGLPMEVYEKTIAHELMHAWMFLDKQPEHVPALEEGVCNLAAYYVLQENRSKLAGFMRESLYKSPSPTYGAGLRRAIRYVQANQFPGLVKMLRSNADFPRGY